MLEKKPCFDWERSILIVSAAEMPSWIERTLRDISEVGKDFFITIRPHQGENRDNEFQKYIKELGLKNARVSREEDIYKQIKSHRLTVTFCSSVFLEALVMNCLVIEYAFNSWIKTNSLMLNLGKKAEAVRPLVVETKERFQAIVGGL